MCIIKYRKKVPNGPKNRLQVLQAGRMIVNFTPKIRYVCVVVFYETLMEKISN